MGPTNSELELMILKRYMAVPRFSATLLIPNS
jgi:hypothetical protein